MTDREALHARRLERWRQTPATRISGPEEAAELIQRVGIASLYPASPEIPNLFHAYVGDPEAGTDSAWDSPSGQVYAWRWALGRREAAFYSVLVRNRPTWVSWELLPAVLRVRGELRTPDELYDLGAISAAAYRIAQALEEAGGVLSTTELRKGAGFPTGKEHRSAYLKAVAELDARLLLAKVFSPDQEDMYHALVSVRYPDAVSRAEALAEAEALDQLLRAYLPHAVYAIPPVLSRHLKLPERELREALDRLAAGGTAEAVRFTGEKENAYLWLAGEP